MTSDGVSTCSNTITGGGIQRKLNILYSIAQGDSSYSQTYDWCNCGTNEGGGLSTGEIAGISAGSGGFTISLLVTIKLLYNKYCRKKE